MNKQLLIFVLVCLMIIGCSLKVRSQGLQEFAKPEKRQCDNSFYSSFGATTTDGVIVVYSAVKGLTFKILQGRGFLRDTIFDEENDRYVLIVKPTEGEYLYYTIRVKAPGYDYKEFSTEDISAGGKPSSCWVLNPVVPKAKKQKTYNTNNKLAFVESAILPGLGQWGKGYVGHGILNMVGEAALVGGTVYFYNSAKKLSSDVSSGQVDPENVAIYNRNVKTYKVLLCAAIVLYSYNLYQSVHLEPKNREYVLAPALIPVNNSLVPSIELTFNF